jgi:ATP-binding cassette, subfamily F, member 3
VPILSCINIAHRFGDDIILDGVSLTIEPGDRIGFVGRNGAGKSTLMKIMGGLLKPDSGTVSLQKGCRVGYLTQDPNLDQDETLYGAAEGAFEALHKLHQDLNHVYELMATAQGAELDKLLKQQEVLDAQIEAAGGYVTEHKIAEVLHGLGFTDSQFTLKVSNLSGGQKGRLALARLLLEGPDVLLLDEPTNHLDIEGRLWLEEFLSHEYRGAVLMVSHDRYLLDAVVSRIIETEQGRIIDYPGNYAKFRELRVERREVMLRAYEAQQGKFRKEEEYIRRFKAGQRARQAKGRETRLEREKDQNLLERPMELSVFNISLPKAERTGDMVASVRGASKSYPAQDGSTKVLFKNFDMNIARGERWGIIGPNGAGKSTFVRCLLGEQAADAGVLRLGSNVKIGYYRQQHEGLDPELQVWRYIQNVILKEAPQAQMSEQAARDLAGAFLFSGDEQEKELGMLSGGERSRAVLAGLLASAKNLLVLDEPTNHLDIQSAERLEEALSSEEGYEGSLILISHDRAIIDATCQHLVILDGHGGAEIFHGNYTEWHAKAIERKRAQAREEAEAKARAEENERRKKQADDKKNQSVKPKPQPAVNGLGRLTMDKLEERIQATQDRIQAIDAELTQVWSEPKKADRLGSERAKLVAELEPLEFEWARRAEEA